MSWRGETNCAIYVAQVKDRTVTSASATMSFGMEVNLSMQFPKSEQCVCCKRFLQTIDNVSFRFDSNRTHYFFVLNDFDLYPSPNLKFTTKI